MELSHLTNNAGGERSQDKAELPNGKSACKEDIEIMCTNLQKLGWRKPEKYSYRPYREESFVKTYQHITQVLEEKLQFSVFQ